MNSAASPRKTSARRQGSSVRTSSSYDALRFLRTTNKWDKDFLPPICPSRFSNHDDFEQSLQDFYYEVVDIMPEYTHHVRKACRLVFEDLIPRLRKNRFGIVFNDPIFCDTFFENLQVVHIQRIHILVPLTIRPVEKERLEKVGYIYLRTPGPVNDDELSRYDPWGFMRSRKDRQYLSPAVLVQLVQSLVDDAILNPYPIEHFTLEPLDLDREGSIIRIRHEQLMFTICLSFGVKIKKTDPYFITKPYIVDDFMLSKRAWRVCYVEAEMKCLKVLHRADHFRHAQAIKVFLALVKLNRIFAVLNEDVIKAIMVYICDNDLVHQNWNRRRCNDIFWSLFDLLYVSIDQRVLKHPYMPEMNLLEKIEVPKLIRLKKHLDYIVEHQHEFERFFNRRVLSCKRRRNQSKNLFAFFGSLRNASTSRINEEGDAASSDEENDQQNKVDSENLLFIQKQNSQIFNDS